MDVFGRDEAARHRAHGTRVDRDVGPVRQFHDAARIRLGQAQGHVAGHRHDPEHVELGRGQGQEDRHGIVLAGIGVDDDLARHMVSAPAMVYPYRPPREHCSRPPHAAGPLSGARRKGRMNITQKLALGSVAVSVVVLGVKFCAYAMTGSVALLSDALESIINVATALAAVWALHVALQPADARHPYGHSKAEYLSAVLEGVLIVGAAIAILREASEAFLHPVPLQTPVLGLAVSAIGSVINAGWAIVLRREGRRAPLACPRRRRHATCRPTSCRRSA